jgi:hypothetical protein
MDQVTVDLQHWSGKSCSRVPTANNRAVYLPRIVFRVQPPFTLQPWRHVGCLSVLMSRTLSSPTVCCCSSAAERSPQCLQDRHQIPIARPTWQRTPPSLAKDERTAHRRDHLSASAEQLGNWGRHPQRCFMPMRASAAPGPGWQRTQTFDSMAVTGMLVHELLRWAMPRPCHVLWDWHGC